MLTCVAACNRQCDDACGCTSAGLDLLDRCIQCSLDAGATTLERAEALERGTSPTSEPFTLLLRANLPLNRSDARSICATAGPATKTPSATSSRSSSTSTSPFPGFTPAPGSSGNAGSKNSVGGAAGVVAGVLLVAAAL